MINFVDFAYRLFEYRLGKEAAEAFFTQEYKNKLNKLNTQHEQRVDINYRLKCMVLSNKSSKEFVGGDTAYALTLIINDGTIYEWEYALEEFVLPYMVKNNIFKVVA